MPIQIRDLSKDSKTITDYETEQGPVTFTYKPSVYSAEVEDKSREYTDDRRAATGVAYLLSLMLIDWDLLDGEEKFPPTLDNLKMLPTAFLGEILEAIGADIRPGEARRST